VRICVRKTFQNLPKCDKIGKDGLKRNLGISNSSNDLRRLRSLGTLTQNPPDQAPKGVTLSAKKRKKFLFRVSLSNFDFKRVCTDPQSILSHLLNSVLHQPLYYSGESDPDW
jgi:hypothetical protein